MSGGQLIGTNVYRQVVPYGVAAAGGALLQGAGQEIARQAGSALRSAGEGVVRQAVERGRQFYQGGGKHELFSCKCV